MRSILLLIICGWSASLAIAGSPNEDHFPQPPNKKGLQVQMIDDAIALGVHHAALNVDLTQLIDPTGQENGPKWTANGKQFAFSPSQVAGLDAQVKPLSDHQIVVTLILLTYASQDAKRNELMLHPRYAKNEKMAGPIAMFNTTTADAADALQACLEFLADRYSTEQGHGRVWGYICGNEVNSHWFWANMGHASPDEVITEYERAVRLIHRAVRKFSREARVYLSLDHFWKERYVAGSATQCLGGREFLDRFAAKANENGDFDWHLAHHPYPEPLTDPRFWLDHVHAAHHNQAHSITFRNLDVLMDYLQQGRLKIEGKPRRVILSEQGFHCNEKRPRGELEQAAAYALAYKTVDRLPGIDAFILHRHTDHAQEGGLNLGLWTNQPGQICSPDRKRKMYEVFQAAGTPDEQSVFAFALPIIEATDWDEALRNLMTP
jgi:hypothetical protein